jgi:2,4-dienoyl-CoA reductase-like NADH-dependent reductase (Old Yellow Enzyme family)
MIAVSVLFAPGKLGSVEIKNRFVHSATHECMATEKGEVTDQLVARYGKLARGGIGLIIPGFLYVHPRGKALRNHTGIHCDEMIPGLGKIVRAVHEHDAKVVFQLVHAGRQTTRRTIGEAPIAPSRGWRDPVNILKPVEMTEEDIHEAIQAFKAAAARAMEAGADGIQFHAAHGYLINQFLSPFFNHRKDSWGGTDEKRFRFLEEALLEVRKVMPAGAPILIKLNAHDYTPGRGITPELAAHYAQRLVEIGIDGIEVSGGTVYYSFMNICRGKVPVKGFAEIFPWWLRPVVKIVLKKSARKFELKEGYHLGAARTIKPVLGQVPLLLVGGMRRVSQMEKLVEDGHADFISMSRPFIREPFLVNAIREGKTDHAACVSCNKCLVSILHEMPIACYCKSNRIP